MPPSPSTADQAAKPRASALKTWLPIAVFSILWADLIRQLSYMWSTNEQYAYGWFVPILAFGLFLKKWPTRPPAVAPDFSFQLSTVSFSNGRFLLFAFPISALVLLLPLRVIHEINQDWSFCSYLLTLVVVALTLYAIHLAGPQSVVRSPWSVVRGPWSLLSPWVKYFAFPICFILVAVNWPYRIENSLKYRLMNAVAALTVEITGWLNIPALRHGNVIELATGSVGVEDACSGIRSLQSTIMAALFLGELYLLKWPYRFLLLAVGIPLAFSFNVVRTLFLTWQASLGGTSAVAKWHGSAGMTISVACFGCLWAIAVLIRKRGTQQKVESRKQKAEKAEAGQDKPQLPAFMPHPSETSPLSTLNPQPSTPVVSSSSAPRFLLSAFCFPPTRRYLLAVGCWSLFCIGVTETWYRSHETDPAQTVRWSVQFPTNSPSAHKLWIGKEVRQILKCDQGDGLSWEEPDGSKWSAYCFRWRAGEATSRMAARDHRPEICLPSSGYKVKADLGTLLLTAHGLELPFRAYVFEDAGRVLYVFFCLWEDDTDKQTGLGRSKYLDRLDSVLAGRRRLGQQTLEIIVNGYAGMEEAERAVRQRLPSLIQLGAAPDQPASLDQPGER
jgi:exosortase